MAAADAGLGAKKLHEALKTLQEQGATPAAMEAAGEALEAFSLANDRTGAAAAHQVLAVAYKAQGQWESALAHLDAAQPLRESTGDWEGVASLIQERVEILSLAGDPNAAREALAPLLPVMDRLGDREGKAHALYLLAQRDLDAGDPDAAEAKAQEGLWALDLPGKERARSALQLLYSNIWIHRQNAEKALDHARQGLALAQQSKSRQAETDAQQQLGIVYALSGDFPTALRHLQDALVGRELEKDAEGKVSVLRELAGVKLFLGEVTEGFSDLAYAARVCREELKDAGAEIGVLQLVQQAADQQNLPEKALDAARDMVVAAERAGDPSALAAAHYALATRLAGEQDMGGAEAHFRMAIRIQEEDGLLQEKAITEGMLGQVLVARGRREDGLALLRQSAATLRRFGSEAAATVQEVLESLSAEPNEPPPTQGQQ